MLTYHGHQTVDAPMIVLLLVLRYVLEMVIRLALIQMVMVVLNGVRQLHVPVVRLVVEVVVYHLALMLALLQALRSVLELVIRLVLI